MNYQKNLVFFIVWKKLSFFHSMEKTKFFSYFFQFFQIFLLAFLSILKHFKIRLLCNKEYLQLAMKSVQSREIKFFVPHSLQNFIPRFALLRLAALGLRNSFALYKILELLGDKKLNFTLDKTNFIVC